MQLYAILESDVHDIKYDIFSRNKVTDRHRFVTPLVLHST